MDYQEIFENNYETLKQIATMYGDYEPPYIVDGILIKDTIAEEAAKFLPLDVEVLLDNQYLNVKEGKIVYPADRLVTQLPVLSSFSSGKELVYLLRDYKATTFIVVTGVEIWCFDNFEEAFAFFEQERLNSRGGKKIKKFELFEFDSNYSEHAEEHPSRILEELSHDSSFCGKFN